MMGRIKLTDSERTQFIQLSGSDSSVASLIAAIVVIRKKQSGSLDERAHMSTQTLGNRLEALRKVEISRSKSISGGDGLPAMDDVYECDDGMSMFRDMVGAMNLREEFLKFFDIYGFVPVIDLNLDGVPGASLAQLSVLMRVVEALTGLEINVTGFAA